MNHFAYGGQTFYGYDIGIIMLNTTFPRIVGDCGNARTWNFPVKYEIVKEIPNDKVVLNLEYEDILPFAEAAKKLEAEGVKAITTSCGFLALFQETLTKEVNVPIFTSSLIMLPLIRRMINPNKKILVMTANSETLSNQHFLSAGVKKENFNLEILGTQHKKTFTNFTVQNWQKVNIDECRQDLFEVLDDCQSLQENNVGAMLLECTNMCPFSDDIRERYNLPVFDFVSLVNFVHETIYISNLYRRQR